MYSPYTVKRLADDQTSIALCAQNILTCQKDGYLKFEVSNLVKSLLAAVGNELNSDEQSIFDKK